MPSSQVFEKFETGRLRSGKRVVKSRKQAIAIYLNERANEQATGSADTPKRMKKPKRR